MTMKELKSRLIEMLNEQNSLDVRDKEHQKIILKHASEIARLETTFNSLKK